MATLYRSDGNLSASAYALSFGLIARAIFVPSTAKHTVWLGLAIGVPIVVAVYQNFLTVDLDAWTRSRLPERKAGGSAGCAAGFRRPDPYPHP
jgi:hypothetical protein